MMALVEQYYWIVLAGAAFLAFLVGILFRGMMGAAKARRAVVERDIAMTELDQVRGELDSLYAAQRKQKEAAAASTGIAPEEARERDERFAKVAQELDAAKAELNALKSSRQDVGSEQASASEADAELQSRNAYLEERVGDLEAKIHEMGQAAPAPVAAPAEAGAGEPASKAEWQVDFLKSRVQALEEKLVETETAGTVAEAPKSDPAVDEELARLRWRNRYLEGRLAYFEEAPAKAEEADTEADDGPVTPEIVPETATPEDLEPAAEPNPVEAEDDSEHPSERMLRALDASEGGDAGANGADTAEDAPAAEEVEADAVDEPAEAVEGEAPPAIDAPDGNADDLTLITGIGPRIQSILNDHGIWHFSQIADWSAANEAWIDEQLNFAGRVGREGWVHQARELVAANANPA